MQKYSSKIVLTVPQSIIFDLLYIKNLLGLHTIDLNEIQWKKLQFHAGIDDITIKIGNVLSGNAIEIQAPAANIRLDIPKDVGVIMYYKQFVGKLTAPDFDTLSGHYYQSKNINTAKAIVNISITLGVGNTRINWTEVK
ncbi:MAG: LiaF domain-containing protein [bacterium]